MPSRQGHVPAVSPRVHAIRAAVTAPDSGCFAIMSGSIAALICQRPGQSRWFSDVATDQASPRGPAPE